MSQSTPRSPDDEPVGARSADSADVETRVLPAVLTKPIALSTTEKSTPANTSRQHDAMEEHGNVDGAATVLTPNNTTPSIASPPSPNSHVRTAAAKRDDAPTLHADMHESVACLPEATEQHQDSTPLPDPSQSPQSRHTLVSASHHRVTHDSYPLHQLTHRLLSSGLITPTVPSVQPLGSASPSPHRLHHSHTPGEHGTVQLYARPGATAVIASVCKTSAHANAARTRALSPQEEQIRRNERQEHVLQQDDTNGETKQAAESAPNIMSTREDNSSLVGAEIVSAGGKTDQVSSGEAVPYRKPGTPPPPHRVRQAHNHRRSHHVHARSVCVPPHSHSLHRPESSARARPGRTMPVTAVPSFSSDLPDTSASSALASLSENDVLPSPHEKHSHNRCAREDRRQRRPAYAGAAGVRTRQSRPSNAAARVYSQRYAARHSACSHSRRRSSDHNMGYHKSKDTNTGRLVLPDWNSESAADAAGSQRRRSSGYSASSDNDSRRCDAAPAAGGGAGGRERGMALPSGSSGMETSTSAAVMDRVRGDVSLSMRDEREMEQATWQWQRAIGAVHTSTMLSVREESADSANVTPQHTRAHARRARRYVHGAQRAGDARRGCGTAAAARARRPRRERSCGSNDSMSSRSGLGREGGQAGHALSGRESSVTHDDARDADEVDAIGSRGGFGRNTENNATDVVCRRSAPYPPRRVGDLAQSLASDKEEPVSESCLAPAVNQAGASATTFVHMSNIGSNNYSTHNNTVSHGNNNNEDMNVINAESGEEGEGSGSESARCHAHRMNFSILADPRVEIIALITSSPTGSVTLQEIHDHFAWDSEFSRSYGTVLEYLQGYQAIFVVSPVNDRVTLRRVHFDTATSHTEHRSVLTRTGSTYTTNANSNNHIKKNRNSNHDTNTSDGARYPHDGDDDYNDDDEEIMSETDDERVHDDEDYYDAQHMVLSRRSRSRNRHAHRLRYREDTTAAVEGYRSLPIHSAAASYLPMSTSDYSPHGPRRHNIGRTLRSASARAPISTTHRSGNVVAYHGTSSGQNDNNDDDKDANRNYGGGGSKKKNNIHDVANRWAGRRGRAGRDGKDLAQRVSSSRLQAAAVARSRSRHRRYRSGAASTDHYPVNAHTNRNRHNIDNDNNSDNNNNKAHTAATEEEAAVAAALHIGSISCSCVSDGFDLAELFTIYRRRGYEVLLQYGVLHVSCPGVFDLFLFENGVVVWWGMNRIHHWMVEDDFLFRTSYVRAAVRERYAQKEIDVLFPSWCSYEEDAGYGEQEAAMDSASPMGYRLEVVEEALERFAKVLCYDHYLIPHREPARSQVMLALSHSLGRSARADYLEYITQWSHRHVLSIPAELSGLVDYFRTKKRIVRLEGELQTALMGITSLKDMPDVLWEMPWLEPYFELAEEQNSSEQRLLWFSARCDALLRQLSDLKTRRYLLFLLASDVFLIVLLVVDVFSLAARLVMNMYFQRDWE